jgi:hypothetical protein
LANLEAGLLGGFGTAVVFNLSFGITPEIELPFPTACLLTDIS